MASRIIVDAFGGDNAPLCNIQGAADAVKEYGVQVILVGKEPEILACAKEHGISLEGISIVHTDEVMDMHDTPTEIVKSKRNTSLGLGLQMVAAGEGEAFVSAGSTGGLLVGATLLVKRIKGIKRPALATAVPTPTGKYLLLDCGANAECRPEMLMDFALMGNEYMKRVEGLANPRIGLLNVGTEDTKGDSLRQETYQLLKQADYNFVGNVEARDVPAGGCDVLVADGFSGNVVLKLTEGVATTFFGLIKKVMMSTLKTKIGALLIKKNLRGLKGLMDYSEHGGAPFLGVRKPVIKAHGSSNAKAIKNAIRQANAFAASGVIEAITVAAAEKRD
ncbi:MAG: phosphate acyltransferase PlsX [Clostridia bacterium]|nr:phosphate acyltransferase PlsX [Clostridia bacterium]